MTTESDIQSSAKHAREYFEVGCLCIINNTLTKQSSDVSDIDAATFYEENCKCSRNYTHLS